VRDESGGSQLGGQCEVGQPQTPRDRHSEPLKEYGLGRIGLCHAAQADFPMCLGWQDDIVRLNPRELLEHGAR
jgi:hypothetical protein